MATKIITDQQSYRNYYSSKLTGVRYRISASIEAVFAMVTTDMLWEAFRSLLFGY